MKQRKILVGSSWCLKETLGYLPWAWVLNKFLYCTWHQQTGWGSPWKRNMSDETLNISQFSEFEWFEWVIFWDETAPNPNDHFRLGRYLGPSIVLIPLWWQKTVKRMVRSFIGPCTKHQPKNSGNGNSAKQNVVCSSSPYTRDWLLMLRWGLSWTECGGHITVKSIWEWIAECWDVSHVEQRARGNSRVGEPVCKLRIITPKWEQDGQRPQCRW